MTLEDLDLNKLYTFADYLKWQFEERVELIRGKIFSMAAPSPMHQWISKRIYGSLDQYLAGQKCEAFYAPFDVRFPRKSKDDTDIITVFQPDIFVLCDLSKIDEKGCFGAPDVVVEILSAANNRKELKYKFDVYEEGGVLEYWVVDPRDKSIQVWVLTDGKFISHGYLLEGDELKSLALPGFFMNVGQVFENL